MKELPFVITDRGTLRHKASGFEQQATPTEILLWYILSSLNVNAAAIEASAETLTLVRETESIETVETTPPIKKKGV